MVIISWQSKTFTDDGNLLNIRSKERFKLALREAMFRELTTQWETNLLARTTFRIVPKWQPRDFLEHTMSKEAEGYYLRCSFANNDTRSSRARFSETDFPTTCLRCQQADETVQHVFLECPKLQPYRNKLFSKLKQHYPKIKINLTTLLTRTEFQYYTIQYIQSILNIPFPKK